MDISKQVFRSFAALFVLLALLVSACDENTPSFNSSLESPQAPEQVSHSSFAQIPALEDLDFDAVQPAFIVRYWELRRTGVSATTIGSAGTEPDSIILDWIDNDSGFHVECLPEYCAYYIVTFAGDVIDIWDTVDELRTFLGAIDTPEEAILLAFGLGYNWGHDIASGAIKETADGYELRLLKLVSDCDPIQTDLFHLSISTAGDVTILSQEAWEVLDGWCI